MASVQIKSPVSSRAFARSFSPGRPSPWNDRGRRVWTDGVAEVWVRAFRGPEGLVVEVEVVFPRGVLVSVVAVKDERLVYINENSGFRPITADELAQIKSTEGGR